MTSLGQKCKYIKGESIDDWVNVEIQNIGAYEKK